MLIICLLIAFTFIGQIGFIGAIILILLVHLLQKSSVYELGLTKPKSWIKTISISLLISTLILGLFSLFINPLIFEFFSPENKDLSRFNSIKNNELMLIIAILSSWITAGFAEEIIWRGYIMKNIANILGSKPISWGISLVITSLIFGILHFYQGPIGVIQTSLMGLFLGFIFIVRGKNNLWVNILTHGSINTISFIAIYLDIL